ncbi:MAG: biotin/lipoyl-binding protein, partial [Planctomycetes bacterium]|nr:biotin/lipoyl-binding protein [Planctomycetota bacterium]
LTSQPAMGAVIAALQGSPLDTGIDLQTLHETNEYWEQVRAVYAPFESGLKSAGADVYEHEMPGGQYTNLKLQAQVLGLAGRWPAIKRAYSESNRLLGDLIKVTPSSKVVGDLAQFMVQNDLSEAQVLEQAATLSLPSSLVSFFQGYLGQPHGGFPEPLRERVLKGEPIIEGRPGASLAAYDFEGRKSELEAKHSQEIRDVDELSAALYPKVFDDFARFREEFGDVSVLPTRCFLTGLELGEEVSFDLERGKTLIVKLTAVGELDPEGWREVFYELNGQPRSIRVADKAAQEDVVARERADPDDPCSVGAPMPGVVVDVKVEKGQQVEAGQALVVLSAMKMEMAVAAPVGGTVARIAVGERDDLQAGDLIVVLSE